MILSIVICPATRAPLLVFNIMKHNNSGPVIVLDLDPTAPMGNYYFGNMMISPLIIPNGFL